LRCFSSKSCQNGCYPTPPTPVSTYAMFRSQYKSLKKFHCSHIPISIQDLWTAVSKTNVLFRYVFLGRPEILLFSSKMRQERRFFIFSYISLLFLLRLASFWSCGARICNCISGHNLQTRFHSFSNEREEEEEEDDENCRRASLPVCLPGWLPVTGFTKYLSGLYQDFVTCVNNLLI
jgi:hypothetical protein